MRVLLVDDEADTVFLLSVLLNRHGYDARTASCGDEAIRIAREFQPDLIFLDLGMPGMNGYELAKNLRGPGLTQATIVAMTGSAADSSRLIEAGIDRYLLKPVQLTAVLGLIAAVSNPVLA